jgi:hypothetical protein
MLFTEISLNMESPHPSSPVDLAAELQRIYDSELNIEISWLWDGGIDLRLGDRMNGFLAEENRLVHSRCHRLVPGSHRAFLSGLHLCQEPGSGGSLPRGTPALPAAHNRRTSHLPALRSPPFQSRAHGRDLLFRLLPLRPGGRGGAAEGSVDDLRAPLGGSEGSGANSDQGRNCLGPGL